MNKRISYRWSAIRIIGLVGVVFSVSPGLSPAWGQTKAAPMDHVDILVNTRWIGTGFVVNGTTYMPLRSMVESFGWQIKRYGSSIHITRPDDAIPVAPPYTASESGPPSSALVTVANDKDVLKGFRNISVLVEGIGGDARSDGLSEEKLVTDVELLLQQSGIHVAGSEVLDIPRLYVNINAIKSDVSNRYSMGIEVSLQETVRLNRSPSIVVIGAITWRKGSTAVCGAIDLEDYARKIVRDHVQAFCNDWMKVNPNR